ncbi:MAG: DUF4129 domain-containing protein [Ferruginibacter sp.]|nr:DUF4129 domain-containing protein [Ferruginibacter sp.]
MASYLDCKIPMYKKNILLVTLFCCNIFLVMPLFAQIDSNSVIENTITEANTNNEDIDDVSPNYENFGKEVLGDTVVNFSDLIINQDSITAWKNSKKYAWFANLDSLLKEKQILERQNVAKNRKDIGTGISFFSSFLNSSILHFFLWFVAIAVVVFIVFKLFLNNGLFLKKSKSIVTEIEIADENDITKDFETLYKNEYKNGNMRMAVRYLFLLTLQNLNNKTYIKFAVDKTNSNYVAEILVTKRKDFAELALLYEYIWYGNIPLHPETFDNIEKKYKQFFNTL